LVKYLIVGALNGDLGERRHLTGTSGKKRDLGKREKIFFSASRWTLSQKKKKASARMKVKKKAREAGEGIKGKLSNFGSRAGPKVQRHERTRSAPKGHVSKGQSAKRKNGGKKKLEWTWNGSDAGKGVLPGVKEIPPKNFSF